MFKNSVPLESEKLDTTGDSEEITIVVRAIRKYYDALLSIVKDSRVSILFS